MSLSFPPQPIKNGSFFARHRAKSFIYAGVFAAILIAALVWEVVRVTAPPRLVVESPQDNFLTKETSIVVTGFAAKNAIITINNEPATPDTSGHFKENLDLRTGLNVITITASSRFAKPNIIYRRVVVTK